MFFRHMGMKQIVINGTKGMVEGFLVHKPIMTVVGLPVRQYGSSGDPELKKVQNRRPKGIVPIGEDYGGYDEDKHEEYENNAESRQSRIRWLKKISSTIIFSSVLGTVVWARQKKQKNLEDNTKNCMFLPNDDLFTGSHNTFCILGKENSPEKVVLPAPIVNDGTLKFIQAMELRSDDVIVASFPKTGITWLQEIVYLIKNNLDYTKASSSVLEDRFPFLEYPYPGVKSIDKMKSPRLIKTHLPYGFLPKNADQAKIIYITRNPKDTVVSYYHFARMLTFSGYVGTFSEFVNKFLNDQLPYCPFFEHIDSFLQRKEDPNVLILTYEELSKDPVQVVTKIASFLDKPLTHDQIMKIVDHTTFEEMALNPSVNYQHWDDLGIRKKNESLFMRKGKVGDWKNYFSDQENDAFDEWIKRKNSFKFRFDYNP